MTDTKPVYAKCQGLVSEVFRSTGDFVNIGDVILTTELMKMTTEHFAPINGTLSSVGVGTSDMVETNQIIAQIKPSDAGKAPMPKQDRQKGDHPALSELKTRRHAISDTGRAEQVAKRHAAGGRSARENIDDLLDEGSFSEIGAHVIAAQRSTAKESDLIDRSAADGVVVGTGMVGDVSVAVIAVDYSVMAGTQGYFHHHKVDRVLEIASRRGLPLILYPEGGGGRPNDTDPLNLSIAGLNITSFHRLAAHAENHPTIAVVHGFCFAGSAAFAAVADVIIGTHHAYIGMGGPAMIEGGGLGTFKPEEIGPPSVHAKNGVLDYIATDEASATSFAKQVLSVLSGSLEKSRPPAEFDLTSQMPINRKIVFDVRTIIEAVVDEASLLEFRREFGSALVTALARIDGKPVGILASDPAKNGGAIDGEAAAKAAGLFKLCQSSRLPVISLIDTPGFMVGPQAEETGQARAIGEMFRTGASIAVPIMAIILRRAYGLGAMAMAGGGFHSADLAISWPSGEVGAMGLEGAVRLGQRKRLQKIASDEEREATVTELVAQLEHRGRAINAASHFEFDDVIEPNETRARIIQFLNVSLD